MVNSSHFRFVFSCFVFLFTFRNTMIRRVGGVGGQVVHVDVRGDGNLTQRDGVDEVGLAAAVVPHLGCIQDPSHASRSEPAGSINPRMYGKIPVKIDFRRNEEMRTLQEWVG